MPRVPPVAGWAGPDCLAYWRGDKHLVVVPIRGRARLTGASGSFRDVLTGRTASKEGSP